MKPYKSISKTSFFPLCASLQCLSHARMKKCCIDYSLLNIFIERKKNQRIREVKVNNNDLAQIRSCASKENLFAYINIQIQPK